MEKDERDMDGKLQIEEKMWRTFANASIEKFNFKMRMCMSLGENSFRRRRIIFPHANIFFYIYPMIKLSLESQIHPP